MGELVDLTKRLPTQDAEELVSYDDVLEGQVVGRRIEIPSAVAVVGEHSSYIAAGATVITKRIWRSRSASLYTAMIESAVAIGNHELALEWEARREAFRQSRHDRRFDWIELFGKVTLNLPKLGAITGGALLVLGFLWAIATKDWRNAIDPVLLLADALHFAVVLVTASWLAALTLALLATVATLWIVGRASARAGQIPWLAHHYAGDHEGDPITPSVVVTALRDLGISALRKSIVDMGDAGASMLSPIAIAGCGVELEVTIPSGTSTEDVQKRHRKLAENMGRHQHEVFITVAQKARTLRLFIADSGALDEPIGPSPLVTDLNIKADYYTGRAPLGDTLRGSGATVSLFQQHILIVGKSNQGKTATLRSLILWLAFDVTVEFRIADLKGVGDWRMFDGIATTLIQGPTDEHVIATTHMLEAGVEEMNRRLTALEESGSEDGVTREMARTPGSGFHPIRLVVDEAQKAYMCLAKDEAGRPYGGKKHNSRYFTAVREIKNQGRAVNVTLDEGAQDPTDENLPKISREASHLRFALFVATKSQAAMALGEAPVEQGAAPHKLRDGLDRGTVVALGPGIDIPRGEPAVTIRSHYVSGKEATMVADRAKKVRARVITQAGRAESETPRSFLDDLDTVLLDLPGDHRIKLADIPALLAALAPSYAAYQTLTGVEVGRRLDAHDIRWTNSQGYPRVTPREVRDGLERLASGQVR